MNYCYLVYDEGMDLRNKFNSSRELFVLCSCRGELL